MGAPVDLHHRAAFVALTGTTNQQWRKTRLAELATPGGYKLKPSSNALSLARSPKYDPTAENDRPNSRPTTATAWFLPGGTITGRWPSVSVIEIIYPQCAKCNWKTREYSSGFLPRCRAAQSPVVDSLHSDGEAPVRRAIPGTRKSNRRRLFAHRFYTRCRGSPVSSWSLITA